MTHLNEGALRRLVDEPFAISGSEREHFQSCDRCRESVHRMRAEAAEISGLFDVAVAPSVDRAQEKVRSRIGNSSRRAWPNPGRWVAGGVAAAVVLLGIGTLTPAGSAAQDLLNVFQPTQVTVVPVTASELQSLPKLREFGTIQMPHPTTQSASDAADAAKLSGLGDLTPVSLPATVSGTPQYEVVSPATGTFTFDAAKASQAVNGPLPAMPQGLDGSTVTVQTGAGEAAVYGPESEGIPDLVIGEMRTPQITSDGASIKTIEDYLLNLPGVSPQLAASIRALGDPAQTLPLPIPEDHLNSQSVSVHGTQGTLISDPNGLGSMYVWEQGNTIFAVGGTLSSGQLLSIANGLS
ncbi:MAG TPA: hypothetical protein VFA78_01480 [Chloroflexota bacterium]|nr:hypothetical protein [Chloroflexota bacterium]